MRKYILTACIYAAALLCACSAWAQLGTFSRQQRIDFTREWKGPRFEDGRPKVAESVLNRAKTVSAEEAWGVLRGAHFRDQFEGGWKRFNVTGDRMVGRVVTAVFMPYRPDVNEVINDHARQEGRVGRGQNSWVIDTLKPGDVLVVDLFGKIKDGTFMGDNLATSIFTKSHNGVIIDGGVRDLTGILEIKGFTGYVRGFDPSAIADVMLMGINVPIRIGRTTVMPGDMVIGDPEGVVFVPPQLAEKVVDTAERIHFRDDWGHLMLREGKYTPGQIDGAWTPQMKAEFERWVAEQRAKK